MVFNKREDAKSYTLKEGDTLRSIANSETAAGNKLTWQELALFNWGTDEEDEANNYLRDEFGARKRDGNNNFILSSEDNIDGQLLIPFRYKQDGLALKHSYTLKLRRKQSVRQFIECCHIPGVTFGFNSSFIRPSVLGYLKKLEIVANRNPEGKIIIFGHTDAVGSDLYNKKLSERRAWSVHAFITNDADAWETLYNHPDEDWGLTVVQQILLDVGYSPGAIDGIWGSNTRNAMRRFEGLPNTASVKNDATFRKKLFAAYMAHVHDVDLAPERFAETAYMGCGEFNPINSSDERSEENRRVTFFLFHESRLPKMPCKFAECGACENQMATLDYRHNSTFNCSFYDSLAKNCNSNIKPIVDWVSFGLYDSIDKQPVGGAKYSLELPDGRTMEGILDEKGFVRLDNVGEGECTLRFHDFHAGDWNANEDEDFLDVEGGKGSSDAKESSDVKENDEDETLNILAQGSSPYLDDDPDDEMDDDDIQEP